MQPLRDRTYGPDICRRRSIRLKGYDYSLSGAYFITICAQNRMRLFGEVADGVMQMNDAGRMIAAEWHALPTRFPTVQWDAFVVMPNHIHGIIVLTDGNSPPVGAPLVGAPPAGATDDAPPAGATDDAPPAGATDDAPPAGATKRATTRVAPTVGDVGAYKSLTTVHYTRGVKNDGWRSFVGRLWQRNYYEHIIRDETELNRIRQYIMENPVQWAENIKNPSL